MDSTVFVTLCDEPYFRKAHQSIKDIRTRGLWTGDLVLITVDFTPPPDFLETYAVTTVQFPRIDLTAYLDKIRSRPFSAPTDDRRELTKTTQWEKLHAFNPYFDSWNRVVWIDAGMRVLQPVTELLNVPWEGSFTAPHEWYAFEKAIETKNWPTELCEAQGKYCIDTNDAFFINCVWIYDTRLNIHTSDFLDCLAYPIWRHNEMGAMNAVLHFQRKVWQRLPEFAHSGKTLYAWSDRPHRKDWTHFCVIKYPTSIHFDI
jgi:hypothetical protein